MNKNKIKKEQNELKQIFETLKEEHNIEELATFSEIDITEKLQRNEMMIIKYKEMYYKELNLYEILERKMETLKGLRYKHYRFHDNHEWNKAEIETYCLPSDEKIILLKKIMAKQQVKVRFFDMCWRAFDKMGWSMHTFTKRELIGL